MYFTQILLQFFTALLVGVHSRTSLQPLGSISQLFLEINLSLLKNLPVFLPIRGHKASFFNALGWIRDPVTVLTVLPLHLGYPFEQITQTKQTANLSLVVAQTCLYMNGKSRFLSCAALSLAF